MNSYRKLHASLIALPLEVTATNKPQGKAMKLISAKEGIPCKPFDNEAAYSDSGLGTAALHTHHLVYNIYTCYAETSQENEWLEC